MASVLSVNLGTAIDLPGVGLTGIDKRPVTGPVEVRAPGPKGIGGSGLVGDKIISLRHHGGDDQAVYAYAREDLDAWETELGRPLASGAFGENLTTIGLDITDTLIGTRWQIGADVVLEVSMARVPCRTFATWLEIRGWVKTYVGKAVPGAYLRVITPGFVQAGDPIQVVHQPDHDVTVNVAFRALTREPELLPRLLAAEALPEQEKQMAVRRVTMELDKA
ncbi:MOSC domain-containing protein [Kibdelosporangium aridum]|uniref:MOSC domain-containing protein n=1 Tax=Kibdelosporangium aridum TaxID=2030 RepID=A0A428YYE7_KIBAR|nr:MOSC domain-containing protein [Kibdelosporangium aridum]RSM75494.1 MOSC domain-containing protein [Kibdelosporangium aridum]